MTEYPWGRGSSGIKILYPKPGTRTLVRFLGNCEWAATHFVERTVPCMGPTCLHCPGPAKDYGFAPAQAVIPSRRPDGGMVTALVILMLSADNSWLDDQPLRGQAYELIRHSSRYTPWQFCPYEKPIKSEPPEAFDVRTELVRIWGLGRAAEKNPNLIPFRRAM